MRAIAKTIKAVAADRSGATAIEYGLICSLIVVLIIAAMQSISGSTISMYDLIVTSMAG